MKTFNCNECKKYFTDSYYYLTELEYCPHCGCYEYKEVVCEKLEDENK